jgi:hypothetical protein
MTNIPYKLELHKTFTQGFWKDQSEILEPNRPYMSVQQKRSKKTGKLCIVVRRAVLQETVYDDDDSAVAWLFWMRNPVGPAPDEQQLDAAQPAATAPAA